MIHNRYQQHGGEDVSQAAERDVLLRHGLEVVEYLDDNDRISGIPPLRLALNTIWSSESKRKLAGVLRKERPDVAHFQNTFPLISASGYYACREAGVPVVQALRNFRTFCPGALLMRLGRPCTDCLGSFLPWRGVLHGCYRHSRSASAVVAAMTATHWMLGTWRRAVDVYIAPTEFVRQKSIAGGLPAGRVVVKPNFVDPDPGVGEHRGGFALFVGRLSPEKGVQCLVEAWRGLGLRVPLKVVGAGPLESMVRELCACQSRVEFLGSASIREVYALMREAAFLIVPSVWYETFCRVLVEAFAAGLPVIASRLGAMAEIVADGETGLHFEPGNADDLRRKVEWALDNPESMTRMGRRAREEFLGKYTGDRNRDMLVTIYASLMARGTAMGSE